MKLTIVKAPALIPDTLNNTIFLGGSIEMGQAEDWQARLTKLLSLSSLPMSILNPRRDDWDATWEQSILNKQFREQVEWELEAQEIADLRIYYFSPGTQSPITLLELGLFASYPSMVCCPAGYWRKGNVDIACSRYGLPVYLDLGSLAEGISSYFFDGMSK